MSGGEGEGRSLSLAIDRVEEVGRDGEEALAAGAPVRVEFVFPDGKEVAKEFGGGMEVFFLKHWLQEEHGFDERNVALERLLPDAPPAPILDILSLIDLPAVTAGATLRLQVTGEQQPEDADETAPESAEKPTEAPDDDEDDDDLP